MKVVKVVAAIIIKDGKIFATQRGYGEFKDGWEFPGGKIEEELEIDIEVDELLDIVEYDYPNFHLSMDCFICHIKAGEIVLKEHEAAKWLTKNELDTVDWLPADKGLIEKLSNGEAKI